MVQNTFTIIEKSGLHARPSTMLVKATSSFKSDFFIEYNDKKVNLKSIMGVMSLGIPNGASVTITVDGEDETEGLESVVQTLKTEGIAE